MSARKLLVPVAVFGTALAVMSSALCAVEGHRAPIRGIEMYYEIHGPAQGGKVGVPLVLLHGGGSTLDASFGHALPFFARDRQVIAIEEQGHGRTSDRDAPFRFDTSADDVDALLAHLGVERADLLGFSNGASVALQVAIRHPARVRKLVFASSFTKRDGARPELWGFLAKADFATMPQPLKDEFLRVNPDPAKLRNMHDKDLARMRSFEDVPDEALRALRAPTLVLLGDRDVTRLEHAIEITRLIPDARLLVVPGGHGDYWGEIVARAQTKSNTVADDATESVVRWVEQFLGAP